MGKEHVFAGSDDNKNGYIPHMFFRINYGNYSVINELCIRFWEEIKARGHKPVGPARFTGIVAPYMGRNISPDDFCYRLVIPIERVDI